VKSEEWEAGSGEQEAGSKEQEAGSKEQGARSREQGAGSKEQKKIIPFGSIASRGVVNSEISRFLNP
jgi:putative peptidoglycan lipid II flippase